MKNINITHNNNQSFKIMPHISNGIIYTGEKNYLRYMVKKQ
jgi:hypothetical protein